MEEITITGMEHVLCVMKVVIPHLMFHVMGEVVVAVSLSIQFQI